ncbi:MAG: hypothetical protein A3F84_08890 [Candidatus Handelsmanbacteria bacterium RIFCSPLOWO2_12_FULL_64_10]|uniref:Polymerase nucleotidyl transferase domain-containing protein n=1 Tax=Handelsmanbacteria sp. (strain RIFCSPLOWO2_12_FULL_64_10) TaxID=1817868 RepID=A0A1F6CM62_HANXR|nr:MAG: hypothetical protein A3F84_08890 [Candidatus Handelsmanbacteria bacterium RIFCSPLOWO2_12_FULL_64_10]
MTTVADHNTLTGLSEEERGMVQEFVRRALEAYPDAIESIRLFGSKARGDARPDSDIDLLVVVRDEEQEQDAAEKLVDIAYDLLEEYHYHSVLSIKTLPKRRVPQNRLSGDPFVKNIQREGKYVWKRKA